MSETVKLKKELWAKVKKCAEAAGRSSPQEFVELVLEKELARIEGGPTDEEIKRQFRGLGYID